MELKPIRTWHKDATVVTVAALLLGVLVFLAAAWLWDRREAQADRAKTGDLITKLANVQAKAIWVDATALKVQEELRVERSARQSLEQQLAEIKLSLDREQSYRQAAEERIVELESSLFEWQSRSRGHQMNYDAFKAQVAKERGRFTNIVAIHNSTPYRIDLAIREGDFGTATSKTIDPYQVVSLESKAVPLVVEYNTLTNSKGAAKRYALYGLIIADRIPTDSDRQCAPQWTFTKFAAGSTIDLFQDPARRC